MLILLSPAKTLDFETPAHSSKATRPALLERSAELVGELQKLSPKKIANLMGVSDKIAALNHERFASWQTPFTKKNAKQAVLAFQGDVYTGLEADTFTADELDFAQQHLRILSGLYGVLRPLDLMQPYRLEMGTRFKNPGGKDLYQFWGGDITAELNKQLRKIRSEVVVNLASNEYFKAVDKKALNAEIVTPAFKDKKNGDYKIISFFAKKARGRMAGWIIRQGLTSPEKLKRFRMDGYRYDADRSAPQQPVFIRDEAV